MTSSINKPPAAPIVISPTLATIDEDYFGVITLAQSLTIPKIVTSIDEDAFEDVTIRNVMWIVWDKTNGDKVLLKGSTIIPNNITEIFDYTFSDKNIPQVLLFQVVWNLLVKKPLKMQNFQKI